MAWNYVYTPYIWPMLASTAFFGVLGFYTWRRRAVSGALPFAVMLLFTALWSLGAALELAAADLETKIFWFKFRSSMKLPAATAELCFALQYANLGRFLTRRNLTLLSFPPLFVFILTLTNDAHHLLWLDFWMDGVLHPARSTLTFSIAGYSFVLALVIFILFTRLFLRSPQHRWLVGLLLSELLIARAAVLLDFINRNPFAPMDPVVLVWNIGAPLYALALFGFRMFDPLPLARRAAIEQLHDGMMVLDLEGRVISVNPAAERILTTPARQARGKRLKDLLPAVPDINLADSDETEIELGIGKGPDLRDYLLRVWPLNDFRGLMVGRMLWLTNVTEQNRAQAQILEQQRTLAVLRERDRLARELHDSLGQTLAATRLQASTARLLLSQGEITEADKCLEQMTEMSIAAEADVREFLLGAKTTFSPDQPFFASLREYVARFSQKYSLPVELSIPSPLEAQGLGSSIEVQFLRIIQEALSNIRKHAGAKHAGVLFTILDEVVQVTIQDDGQGFDPGNLAKLPGNGFGLRAMRERAESLGGCLKIFSQPGWGTKIIVGAPIQRVVEHRNGIQ